MSKAATASPLLRRRCGGNHQIWGLRGWMSKAATASPLPRRRCGGNYRIWGLRTWIRLDSVADSFGARMEVCLGRIALRLDQARFSLVEVQVTTLAKFYDFYVPDLLHFGGSSSPSPDRSTGFQAACIAAARRGGCTVVGFSYGSFVVFIVLNHVLCTGPT